MKTKLLRPSLKSTEFRTVIIITQTQIKRKAIMSTTEQYAISLVSLTVPSSFQGKKVIISINFVKEEIFIKHQKSITKQAINLYRQCLFCPQKPSSLSFKIYQVHASGKKALLQEMKVSTKDINSIKKQHSLFKSQTKQFSLAWEGWIHSELSEDLQSQYTDRDYSELDLPFENQSSSEIWQDLIDTPKLGNKESSTQGSRTPQNLDDQTFTFDAFPSQLSKGGSAKKLPSTGKLDIIKDDRMVPGVKRIMLTKH